LAWNGDVDCTSMMRGFSRTLLCMRDLLCPGCYVGILSVAALWATDGHFE
jgi:hypothetical protein